MTVRAGAVTIPRAALYVLGALLAGAVVGTAVVVAFGGGRFFTGLLVGAIVGVGVGAWLFARDAVLLDDSGIAIRKPWSSRSIGWERVRGARFTDYPEAGRWCLTLALKGAAARSDEVMLVALPPVVGAVTNPYDMRKREQLKELYLLLSVKEVPVSVPAPITEALRTHWQVEPKIY
ncbi:PH domain-containing protein [Antrihabitans cavernicola]|uniref:Uncharacterized protein n=1 Tax=Antrihabitans cavernicola TaxID=2495913 RepID=A0A5A7SGD3_9NOCA|nr:PH domain-containing protein [Spelaeibacter cavernicola]KAA0023737.1 hypothetical protein FOY51_03775 [Spelaeibacter cavernicola]